MFKRILLVPLFSPLTVQAQAPVQINWGTATVVQDLITSDGSAVSASEFKIELGGFVGGFVPTNANIEDWVSNWQVFDAITTPDTDPSDAFIAGSGTSSRFVGSDFLAPGQTSLSADSNGVDIFGAGEQAYVFIRNSDTTDVGSEWLLYTSQEGNDWVFPAAQLQFSPMFFVSDVDEVLFGSVNGDLIGEGVFTDSSSDFVLRTHTFGVAVPEPTTGILLLGSTLGLLLRRKRLQSW